MGVALAVWRRLAGNSYSASLLPGFIAAVALFLYLNGAFFSTYSALHIDLSINLTAAHALRDGANPYGETTLIERAKALGSPTDLVYGDLFTSYIQPPTSALSLVPLSFLPWREATRAYLVLNNLILFVAVALTLVIVRPDMPRLWAVAAATVLVMGFSQIYGSFALGQVDATICLLLVVGLWGIKNARPAVTGSAIAVAAAIKLIPGTLILYFLWKRKYDYAIWTAGVGAAIFLVSLPLAGIDTYRTYFGETVPGLLKGSTHYANISIAGAVSRAFIDGPVGGRPPIASLAELPANAGARAVSIALSAGVIAAVAMAMGRGAPARGQRSPELAYVVEYYLAVAAALLVSSVTWEFYLTWLLPLFIAVFLAPDRVLPGDRPARWAGLAVLATAYLLLNYPGDLYLFDVNSVFYHPEWVPGVWVEARVHLYHTIIDGKPAFRISTWDEVPVLRLTALACLTLALAALVRESRLPGKAAQRQGLASTDTGAAR